MSLLLDALKKAAEQKAKKSKEEAPAERASDETLFDAHAAEEIPGLGDDSSAAAGSRADETQLEHTEARAKERRAAWSSGDDTGLDFTDLTDSTDSSQPAPPPGEETGIEVPDSTRTNVGREYPERDAGDDTGLDIPDATQARLEPKQAERPPSADDTGLDIPDATRTSFEAQQPERQQGDETGLELPGSDQAAPDESSEAAQGREDETIVFGSDDLSDFTVDRELDTRRPVERDDETDVNHTGGLADETAEPPADEEIAAQVGAEHSPAAETGQDDDTGPAGVGDQTDISVPVARADQIEMGAAADEDLSLLLVEADDTGPASGDDTTFSNPRAVEERLRAEAEQDSSEAELGLVDPTTQTRIQQDQTDTQGPTITNPSATRLYGDDTTADGRLAAPTRSTITRPDTTSTHTYAPDNYDRTLMKLPSDDASRLFAGMKSDADVVMTPDHAKKIFRSKNSAQRMQNYKVYGGVVIALLLAVALIGGYQYQQGAEQIDVSLMPLKRDPMPGQIKLKQQQESALFGGSEGQVDARTIEIVQSATTETAATGAAESPTEAAATDDSAQAMAAAETESGTVAEAGEASTATVDSAPVEPEPSTMQTEVAMAETMTSSMPAPEPKAVQSGSSQGAAVATAAASRPAAADTGGSLRIVTSSQYREADIWLREAYTAYQAGDLQLALSRYNQVLEIDPMNRNALLGRAAIYVQQGRADAAIEDYQTLLLANPKDSLAMSSLLGVASYSPLETESQLKLMIRDEPDSPYLNFALANAYGAQGRWHDAQRHYFTALQNNPEDPNYAYNLAVSLEHISQPGSARIYYQRALDNIKNGLATFSPEVVGQRLQALEKL